MFCFHLGHISRRRLIVSSALSASERAFMVELRPALRLEQSLQSLGWEGSLLSTPTFPIYVRAYSSRKVVPASAFLCRAQSPTLRSSLLSRSPPLRPRPFSFISFSLARGSITTSPPSSSAALFRTPFFHSRSFPSRSLAKLRL